MELEEDFKKYFEQSNLILMEGALGERLKREFNILPDEIVALASHIYDKNAREILKKLFNEYIRIAKQYNFPIMISTPTRRANKERVQKSKYSKNIIYDNVSLLKEIKKEQCVNGTTTNIYIGGLMGCRGDAYKATEYLSEEESIKFHSWQANLFKDAQVDFLYAGIMPVIDEACGMARAMEQTGLPYIISFMIRKDGRLLDGTTIHDAIKIIDFKTTNKPLLYMTNCVHPTVLNMALSHDFNRTDLVRKRFKGIQANTSPLSPEELDNSQDLKTSDAKEFAEEMFKLYKKFNIKVFGGCCGTDNTHMNEMAKILNSVQKNSHDQI